MSGDLEITENLAGWKAIERALETLRSGGSYVKAGVAGEKAAEQHDDEATGAKLTNAQLATIHEFGTSTIPARPFILGTFSLHEAEYRRLLAEKILPAILKLRITPEYGLKVLGEKMASDMRNRMVDGEGIPPPLAASTIAAKERKGRWNRGGLAAGASPRPLVDTGRLRNSISYAVVIRDDDEP